jgi:hypothetical protein
VLIFSSLAKPHRGAKQEKQMGTRSITRVFDGEKLIACFYRQMDSYPTGHGQVLADFIQSRKFVNGFSDRAVFNGMGCFAAQLIGHLKGGEAGGIYMVSADAEDEEFVYEIRGGYDREHHQPLPVVLKCKSRHSKGFEGSAADFAAFAAADQEED